MANWSNPLLTSTYTNFLTEVKDRDTDLALQFDGTTSSNIPTGAIRWNSSVNRWQKWSGSAWGELTSTYALTGLSTTGNATIGGTLGSGAFTSSGTVTGTALLPTGSTVPANGIYLPSANTLGLATSTTCRVLVDSSGRVGIGTTSPSTGFHITNAPGSATIGNLYISNSGQARYHLYNGGGIAEWIFGQKTGGDHNFKLSKSVAGSESDYFTIDTSGNVGIGANPTAVKLYVDGQITGASGSFALRASNGSGTDQTSIGLTRVGAPTDQKSWEFFQGNDGRCSIRTINDAYTDAHEGIAFGRGTGINIDNIRLSTMGSERLRVTSAGLVGIATSLPIATLDVGGSTATSNGGLSNVNFYAGFTPTGGGNTFGGVLAGAGVNGNTPFIAASRNGAGTGLPLAFFTDGTERIRVTSAGNVGIGTTSPSYLLDVAGTTRIGAATGDATIEIGAGASANRNAYIDLVGDTTYTDFGLRLIREGGGANTDSALVHRGTGSLRIEALDAGNVAFKLGGSERARITSDGRFGLGTSSPGTAFEVALPAASATVGNIRIVPSSAGQARCHFYNGGATAEWLFGQKTSTDHDFKLSKSVAGSESDYLAITTSGVLKFDSGYGSAAPAYGCRAWVNFNGTGADNTNQTIRASGNVASVYKTSTGNYTVNFATAMPDANYAVTVISNGGGSGLAVRLINPTTTGFTVYTSDTDGSVVCATVMR
jgi:hypothetical protein